jgi:hypothetical protein
VIDATVWEVVKFILALAAAGVLALTIILTALALLLRFVLLPIIIGVLRRMGRWLEGV